MVVCDLPPNDQNSYENSTQSGITRIPWSVNGDYVRAKPLVAIRASLLKLE